MSFSIDPFVLTAILAGIAALVAAIFAFRASRILPRAVFALVALLCAMPALYILALLHPELTDTRFRAYKQFYGDVREGMTRGEVFAVLERRYPPNGSRLRPKVMSDELNHLGFFMNPETSREPNCEGIFLSLKDGRVTNKNYSPD